MHPSETRPSGSVFSMATRFAPPSNINILSLLLTEVIYLWYVCISLAWILCLGEDFFGVTHYFHLDSSQKQLHWLEQKGVTVWGCCTLELCACLHLQLSCTKCQCSACQPEVPHLEGIKKSRNTATKFNLSVQYRCPYMILLPLMENLQLSMGIESLACNFSKMVLISFRKQQLMMVEGNQSKWRRGFIEC